MVIKQFRDGSQIEFRRGRFDDYCVWMSNVRKGYSGAPKDVEYFTILNAFASKFGAGLIYEDFCSIYSATTKEIQDSVLTLIEDVCRMHYGKSALSMEKVFTILYAGMVAEENKDNAKLGKRIKRLGMHSLLMEKTSPSHASEFMKKMYWRDLECLCAERGF